MKMNSSLESLVLGGMSAYAFTFDVLDQVTFSGDDSFYSVLNKSLYCNSCAPVVPSLETDLSCK